MTIQKTVRIKLLKKEQPFQGDYGVKITAIKTFFVDGVFRPWTFVKIETSDPGTIGWGDCTDWGAAIPIASMIDRMSEWVIGRDPMDVEAIWWAR